MMENRKFWTEFIEMYRSMPCLWKVKSREYSNRILKIHAYEQLIRKLKEIYPNADREMAVKKINNIRTNHRRDRKKIQESLESGNGDVYVSPLWYYDMMAFLDEQDGDNGTERSAAPQANKIKTEKVFAYPKKKTVTDEDSLIKLAMDKLTSSDNRECSNIARGWASQYDEMEHKQKIFARKLISDVLFLGCMGELDMSHVMQIQDILIQRTTSVELKIERNEDGFESEEELLAP